VRRERRSGQRILKRRRLANKHRSSTH
jgi:hypothetical protein